MWQLTAKDKSKRSEPSRQQILTGASRGQLYLVANRWQCAQENMFQRTGEFMLEKGQNRGPNKNK